MSLNRIKMGKANKGYLDNTHTQKRAGLLTFPEMQWS